MYARHTEGTFVLRIEDTDAERSQPELVEAIRDSLRWLNLDWDEEYSQSDRFDLYRQAANGFLAAGQAYYCDCSQEAVKERNEATGGSGYDGFCRDRGLGPSDRSVVRFRTPDDGTVSWVDVVRGPVEFECALLEDFVIVRSNGVPMFHVANAYDDVDMGITHVIRGEDLVNTVPRVLLLRQALGAPEPPIYAHLPLIVNEKRQKLSKRRDDVSVGDYADRGFLPDAMRNYLLTLGWGPKDDVEIRPIEEFVAMFELEDINKAPAFFDLKKLEHFNATYIRALDPDEFAQALQPFLEPYVERGLDPELFAVISADLQQRLTRLDGLEPLVDWIIGDPPPIDDKDWRKVMLKPKDPAMTTVLDELIVRIGECTWDPDAIESAVMGVGEDLETKSQLPMRLAVTGRRAGIPLFGALGWMSRETVLDRLVAARARLDSDLDA